MKNDFSISKSRGKSMSKSSFTTISPSAIFMIALWLLFGCASWYYAYTTNLDSLWGFLDEGIGIVLLTTFILGGNQISKIKLRETTFDNINLLRGYAGTTLLTLYLIGFGV